MCVPCLPPPSPRKGYLFWLSDVCLSGPFPILHISAVSYYVITLRLLAFHNKGGVLWKTPCREKEPESHRFTKGPGVHLPPSGSSLTGVRIPRFSFLFCH